MIIISSSYYLLGGPILNSVIWIGLRLQVWTEILDDQAEFTTDQSQKVSKYPNIQSMKWLLQLFSPNTFFFTQPIIHMTNSLINPRN